MSMQYFQNIFILLGALNVKVWFKPKTIVVSYALSLPQAIKIWADWIGNCPRSLLGWKSEVELIVHLIYKNMFAYYSLDHHVHQ